MRTKLKPLENKVFRLSLDTVYFTAFEKLSEDYFSSPERLGLKLEGYAKKIQGLVFNNQVEIERVSKGFVIKETSNFGIYVEIGTFKRNIKFNIQFKGVFFASDDSFQFMKSLMLRLINELDFFFRVTRIDVCQDIILDVDEILPYPNAESLGNNYKYHFRWEKAEFGNFSSGEYQETGFRLQNSRYVIRLYDKRLELGKAKSKRKIEYYQRIYGQVPIENPISRFELQIKQESCQPFYDKILDLNIGMEFFCKEVLRYFSKTHKLRKRKRGSADKDWNRQPIEKNWEHLFYMKEASLLRLEDKRVFRFTETEVDFHNLSSMCAQYAVDEDITLSEVVKKLMREDPEPLMKKAYERKRLREETTRELNRLRRMVLDEGAKPQGKLL